MIYPKLHKPGQLIHSVTVYAVMDRNDIYLRHSVAQHCDYAARTFRGEWDTRWPADDRTVFCEMRKEYVAPVIFRVEDPQEAQMFQFKYAQDTVCHRRELS